MPNPVTLTLPWSVLISTNQRTNPAGWGRMKGRQFLTREYRAALNAAEQLVQGQVRGERPRFTGPVALEMRFFEPDRRRRDPSNLVKLIEDAMAGVVYQDDAQICRSMWERAGVDRRDPRVEIRVTALASQAGQAA